MGETDILSTRFPRNGSSLTIKSVLFAIPTRISFGAVFPAANSDSVTVIDLPSLSTS